MVSCFTFAHSRDSNSAVGKIFKVCRSVWVVVLWGWPKESCFDPPKEQFWTREGLLRRALCWWQHSQQEATKTSFKMPPSLRLNYKASFKTLHDQLVAKRPTMFWFSGQSPTAQQKSWFTMRDFAKIEDCVNLILLFNRSLIMTLALSQVSLFKQFHWKSLGSTK